MHQEIPLPDGRGAATLKSKVPVSELPNGRARGRCVVYRMVYGNLNLSYGRFFYDKK